jgi:uncharacterized protein YyaL (SSP411 family)
VSLPDRIVTVIDPPTACRQPSCVRQNRVDNKATAYVCVGATCSLPMTDPRQLTAALQNSRTITEAAND